MNRNPQDRPSQSYKLAARITRAASLQTFYTIYFLVDRQLIPHAYQAYAYFRWLDDTLDSAAGSQAEKIALLDRQESLLETLYQGGTPTALTPEEGMLATLVASDPNPDSDLGSYLGNMMALMRFDASRRGRLISQAELSEYSRRLAVAVTDAIHYFIGHDNPPPRHEGRYLAATAAHITHMLRDMLEDIQVGYYNLPGEYLHVHNNSARIVENQIPRDWVCNRVQLARRYFQMGRAYFDQVPNFRLRLAGVAYTARFEWMLRTIERENYCLRTAYGERKSLLAGLWMGWSALKSIFAQVGF